MPFFLAALMLVAPERQIDTTRCAGFAGTIVGLKSYSRQRAAPGTTIRIEWTSRKPTSPFEEFFDPRCVQGLRVSTPQASFSPDLRSIRLAPGIARGGVVTISGTFEGKPLVLDIRIMDPGEELLDGIWSERSRSGACAGSKIAELVFGPYGYSYTYPEAMIETMTSGSGIYSWRPASGKLTLDEVGYAARLSTDGTLVIDGYPFGMWPSSMSDSCRLTLARVKAAPDGG